MSESLYEYLAKSRTPWIQHVGRGGLTTFVHYGSGWHFCFPRQQITPGIYWFFYGWGSLALPPVGPSLVLPSDDEKVEKSHFYPNTEQFIGGIGLPQKPITVAHAQLYQGSNDDIPGSSGILCDDQGRLYCWHDGLALLELEDNPGFNHLGLGPENPDEIRRFRGSVFINEDAAYLRQLRIQRDFPTRVYGYDGDLVQQKTVRVAMGQGLLGYSRIDNGLPPENDNAWQAIEGPVSLALSDSGRIWITGCARSFALPSEFPENDVALPWFRQTQDYVYESIDGTHTEDEPLEFADIRITSFGSLLALTKTGRLFHCGNTRANIGARPLVLNITDSESKTQDAVSTVFREVTGFLDTVAVTNGGSNYSAAFAFAERQFDTAINANAFLSCSVVRGSVTKVEIAQSGYGFVGEQVLELTGTTLPGAAAPAAGATATAAAFGRAWKFLGNGNGGAAICEDGVLYHLLGSVIISSAPNPTAFVFPLNLFGAVLSLGTVRRVPGQSEVGYRQVATGVDFGIALLEDGSIETWGVADRTPTLAAQYALTSLSESGVFVSVACGANFAAALRDDGKIFTYGSNSGGQCGRGPTKRFLFSFTGPEAPLPWGEVPGDAVWGEIFASEFGMIANRSGEQFDQLGNRLNPLPPYQA
jgi:hypothetical protein